MSEKTYLKISLRTAIFISIIIILAIGLICFGTYTYKTKEFNNDNNISSKLENTEDYNSEQIENSIIEYRISI